MHKKLFKCRNGNCCCQFRKDATTLKSKMLTRDAVPLDTMLFHANQSPLCNRKHKNQMPTIILWHTGTHEIQELPYVTRDHAKACMIYTLFKEKTSRAAKSSCGCLWYKMSLDNIVNDHCNHYDHQDNASCGSHDDPLKFSPFCVGDAPTTFGHDSSRVVGAVHPPFFPVHPVTTKQAFVGVSHNRDWHSKYTVFLKQWREKLSKWYTFRNTVPK